MTRTPPHHRARPHSWLLADLESDARDAFAGAARPWDPRGAQPGADPGQGLLDCVAAALDVVWGYQEAWADEAFLGTARLPASTARLLALVGIRPRPPLSATGLQQLRLKAGTAVTIPAGFAVAAPPTAAAPEAVYETDVPLRADARLNELQPFLSVTAPVAPLPAAGVGIAPPPLPADPGASIADHLASRVDAAQRGAALARDAARARSDALQLADLARTLADAGADTSCPETFGALCDQLCAQAHALVEAEALAAAHPVEPLTEAQQLVLGALARVDSSMPGALGRLEEALGRRPGEGDAAYAARLDALAEFLDALVEGILAQARDDLVRLHGTRALGPLDTGLAGALTPGGPRPAPGRLGTAEPGDDRLYLLPTSPAPGAPVRTHAGLLRPGDWLVLADVVEEPAPRGGTVRREQPREAVRVVRVDDRVAPLLGERATHVVVTPPLQRRYDLARTVLLGNVVPVSHGRTVRRTVRGPGPWPLDGEPLAWVPDAAAPDGRVPAVQVRVAGERWRLAGEVADLGAQERAFTVSTDLQGRTVVRVGDGGAGAAVPPDLDVELTTRVGTGAAGNRPPGAADQVRAPVPEVVGTRNLFDLSGGADAEDPAEAGRRATAGVQTLDRAVTPAAIEALLQGHGLVARAAVGHDPVARRRHLRVVVTGHGGRALTPGEHEVLGRFLAGRVPPGLTVRTVDRRVVLVRARVLLAVAPDADPLLVTAAARERLGVTGAEGSPGARGLLHPDAVRLGQPVDLSDLHRALAGLPGLVSVVVEALHRDAEPERRADRIALAPEEEPRWAPDVDGVDGLAVRWEEARDR
jgi:hypothetical protein